MRIAIANKQEPYDTDRADIVECQIDLCARITRNMTVVNGTFNLGISKDLNLKGVNISRTRSTSSFYGNGTAYPYQLYIFEISNECPSYMGARTFSFVMDDFMHLLKSLADVVDPEAFIDTSTN